MRIAQTVLSLFILMNVSLAHAEKTSTPLMSQQQEVKNKDRQYENFQYTSEDIDRIRKTKNIKFIIAAAHQMEFWINADPVSFMRYYLHDILRHPSGLSLYINYLIHNVKIRGNSANKEIEHLLQKFIEMVPKNGYAYYLAAYYYLETGDFEKCLEYTEKGVSTNFFDNYWKELSAYLMETSHFLGYAKIIAHKQALPLSHNSLMCKRISDYILEKQPSRKNILLCKKMGEILYASSSTILEELIALSILRESLTRLNDDQEARKELKKVEKKKEDITFLMKHLSDAGSNPAISEKRWEQYGDDLFSHSESYAMKKLMAEYPISDSGK